MDIVPLDRFEELVADALDSVPVHLADQLENLAVVVEDEPDEPGLLGRYDGIPLTERGEAYGGYGAMVLPDTITIFRGPLCRMCADEAELVEQVRITVVHEIGHYFGIDDHRLDDLGYG